MMRYPGGCCFEVKGGERDRLIGIRVAETPSREAAAGSDGGFC